MKRIWIASITALFIFAAVTFWKRTQPESEITIFDARPSLFQRICTEKEREVYILDTLLGALKDQHESKIILFWRDDKLGPAFAEFSRKSSELSVGVQSTPRKKFKIWIKVEERAIFTLAKQKGRLSDLKIYGAVQTLNKPWPKTRDTDCP